MTRQQLAERVIEAARRAIEVFAEHGLPTLKTDAHLPEPYLSPSARMMDAAPMMALHAAIVAYDAAPDDNRVAGMK